jgi:poly(3-hydroxybutyrate) depolymerase
MNLSKNVLATIGSAALTLCLTFSLIEAPSAAGQQPAGKGAPKGGINRPPDPRVQQRTYRFQDTNEDLPYALFVSSKVSATKKNPLIVALHGLGGDGNSLLRGNALDLAEEGGYILVGPMGYNPQGWYGSPVIGGGRGGKGKAPAAPVPPNLTELSEKDVLNVLEMIRREFNVDERRTYLMGHSMGGAGALHLGTKHASIWAAVASMAPAAFVMQPSILESVKDTMPLILIHGDADTVVPVDVSRRWNQTATSLKMAHFKYLELPGADHGTVITQGVPEIFQFFQEHTK